MGNKEKKYYAYLIPGTGERGVTDSWAVCESKVKGIREARYRGFKSKTEAEAWLHAGAAYEVKIKPEIRPGIYFDAGTGRGAGVEISVTDETGKDLLPLVLPKTKLNKFGKHPVKGKNITNNYGELLAMKYALMIAEKKKTKHIFGDSKLVIEYWSMGLVANDMPEATKELAKDVLIKRLEFEADGGAIERISGDWNPADLGFH